MAGGFKGNPADLAKASQQVQQNSEQLNGHKADLLSKMESTRTLWQGEAATTFNQIMQDFNDDFGKVNQALGEIADRLQQAGTSMSNNQDQTNSAIKSMGSSGIGSVLG
ncbi:WXG100 family type VII secretion target [Amycolatopsis sp. NPDC051903]|uniref:WXG100 family type VII secretion target n=1 Tax=Amycolatopsis sp. NPDC051903 TaxID=3363936 RepID=UPI0037A7CD3C